MSGGRGIIIRKVALPEVSRLLRRLAGEHRVALLDSAGGPAGLRRWSMAAFDPFHLLSCTGGVTRRVNLRNGAEVGPATVDRRRNPLHILRQALKEYAAAASEAGYEAAARPGLPTPGAAAIGFMSYEMGRHVERLPGRARRDVSLPDMHWCFYDHLLVMDHAANCAYVTASDAGGRSAAALVERWLRVLDEPATAEAQSGRCDEADEHDFQSAAGAGSAMAATAAPAGEKLRPLAEMDCTFSRAEYLKAVERGLEYIAAGDIFQVNLSQRFSYPLDESPVELYLRLRQTNAAPYAAYLADDGWAVLSSSPELFLDVAAGDGTGGGGRVVTRPIKGTRPRRAGDAAFNRQMVAELLASGKDAAELVMIVDLLRNDLGRVCDYGSVRVTEPRTIEEYASVFHSVAEIEGRLNGRYDLVDLLRATFPGGSITGAPKVRSMEIIDELEPVARSVYTGAVGCIGLDGSAHLNLAIRTLIADRGRLHMQVGGGIVADSDPAAEYEETLAKARGMLRALGIADG